METRFDEKTHSYYIDEKRATGVTTIIGVLAKPALIPWAARMTVEWLRETCEWSQDGLADTRRYSVSEDELEEAKVAHTKKKEAAGEHGTGAHEAVEVWVNECLTKYEGKPVNDFAADSDDPILKFKSWAVENIDQFLFSERRMYNKELFIAGTADFAYIGKDGKRYMADFKTSSGIYGIDYWLQVAAYRYLAEAEGDESYDGATIVRLGKDGAFEVQQLYDYETYKEAFLCCLKLYRAQAALGGMVVKGE